MFSGKPLAKISLFNSLHPLFFLFFLLATAKQKQNPLNMMCTGSRTTAFSKNLDALLSSISARAVQQSGFYDDSAGQYPDNVYGLAMCRGDVSRDTCESCLSIANADLSQRCPSGTSATIWYDQCMLRYCYTNFLSIVDTDSYCVANGDDISLQQQEEFNRFMFNHLENLGSIARASPLMFATGAANFSTSLPIYGLLQCTRNLPGSKCNECLSEILSTGMNCTYGKTGGRVLARSCYVRFQDSLFYTVAESSPDPVMAPEESIGGKTVEVKRGKPSAKLILLLVAIFLLVTILGFAAFCYLRKARPKATFAALSFFFEICFTPQKMKREREKGLSSTYGARGIQHLEFGAATGYGPEQEMTLKFIGMGLEQPMRRNTSVIGRVADPEIRINVAKMRLLLHKGTQNVASYDLQILKAATNDFSLDKCLGKGGSGQVFQGILDGQKVAIKRSILTSEEAHNVENELAVAANLEHDNVVKLLGYCFEQDQKLLVYEYLPERSLNKHLFYEDKRKKLGWERRYHIIKGIGQGLLYLHRDSRLNIVHRDLKSDNILLDQNFNPKICDFDISRIFNTRNTHENTDFPLGTPGYRAPELLSHGQYSIRSDVYSYGVLVLEILTGRRRNNGTYEDLLELVATHFVQGTEIKLVDPDLNSNYQEDEVLRCIDLGLRCVHSNPKMRPDMPEIMNILTGLESISEREQAMGSRTDALANLSANGAILASPRGMPVIYSVNNCTDTELVPR